MTKTMKTRSQITSKGRKGETTTKGGTRKTIVSNRAYVIYGRNSKTRKVRVVGYQTGRNEPSAIVRFLAMNPKANQDVEALSRGQFQDIFPHTYWTQVFPRFVFEGTRDDHYLRAEGRL
ncbi:MAG: hypothetical protein ACYC3X_29490 [Pirellulaceae bacterium]